jgi:hypothetical protein
VTLPGQLVDDPRTQQELENIRKRFPLGGQDIATSAITATHIAPDAVGASELADNSVAQANMLDDSVGAGEIIAGAVGDSEINDAYIVSGSYEPTLTAVTNIDGAPTADTHYYTRIGGLVWVHGRISLDATAGGGFEVGISLPIASNFSATTQAQGTAANTDQSPAEVAKIQSDATNDRARINGQAVDTGENNWNCIWGYVIL